MDEDGDEIDKKNQHGATQEVYPNKYTLHIQYEWYDLPAMKSQGYSCNSVSLSRVRFFSFMLPSDIPTGSVSDFWLHCPFKCLGSAAPKWPVTGSRLCVCLWRGVWGGGEGVLLVKSAHCEVCLLQGNEKSPSTSTTLRSLSCPPSGEFKSHTRTHIYSAISVRAVHYFLPPDLQPLNQTTVCQFATFPKKCPLWWSILYKDTQRNSSSQSAQFPLLL